MRLLHLYNPPIIIAHLALGKSSSSCLVRLLAEQMLARVATSTVAAITLEQTAATIVTRCIVTLSAVATASTPHSARMSSGTYLAVSAEIQSEIFSVSSMSSGKYL